MPFLLLAAAAVLALLYSGTSKERLPELLRGQEEQPSAAPAREGKQLGLERHAMAKPGEEALSHLSAGVAFLHFPGGQPLDGSSWSVLREDEPSAREQVASAEGVIELVPGHYSLEPNDDQLVAHARAVTVLPGHVVPVWVSEVQALAVEIVDGAGSPVSGAQVIWRTRLVEPLLASTNEDGRAFLDGFLQDAGTLDVVAKGFQPFRTKIQGGYWPEDPFVVRLEKQSRSTLEIAVVDQQDGSPIPHAKLEILEPNMRLVADSEGNARLPNWLRPTSTLAVSATGYWDVLLLGWGGRDTVSLAPRKEVLAEVRHGDGSPARGASVAVLSIEMPGENLSAEYPLSAPVLTGAEGIAQLALPGGAVVIVRASKDGSAVLKELHVSSSLDTAYFVLEPLAPLRVHLLPVSGEPQGAVVKGVRFNGERIPAEHVVGNQFVLPEARALEHIRIHGANFAPVFIKRAPAFRYEFGQYKKDQVAGDLLIHLDEGYSAAGTLLDQDSIPYQHAGITIRRTEDLARNIRLHPELGGGSATSLPAWVVASSSSEFSGVTDANGRFQFDMVPAADYRLLLTQEEAPYFIRPIGQASEEAVFTVPNSSAVQVQLQRPVLLHLKVMDMFTKLPVRECTVTLSRVEDPWDAMRPMRSVAGGNWQYWVLPSELGNLEVRSPGYVPKLLDLKGRTGLDREAVEVFLEPVPAVTIEFVGEACEELAGTALSFLLVETVPGSSRDQITWQDTLTVSGEHGYQVQVFPPAQTGELQFSESTDTLYRFRFSPDRIHFEAGESYTVEVSLR